MPKQTPATWEQRIRDAASMVETDLQKLIGYVNDEVMPDVRRNGSAALRTAATELSRLAERMEHSVARSEETPPPPPREETNS